MRACERSKKSIGIRTNEVRLYDIGISCIAPLSEFTHMHATHWGLHQFTDLLYNGSQITQATAIVGHPPLPSVL